MTPIRGYPVIVLGVAFLTWLVCGIAITYTRGLPPLSPQVSLAHLPPLDLARVGITPAEAAYKGGLEVDPTGLALVMIMDRPAYRFSGREPATVFADTGDRLVELGPAGTERIAAEFMNLPQERVHDAGLRNDLHEIKVDDDAHTQLYVSAKTGEVVGLTTRRSRALAWLPVPVFANGSDGDIGGETLNLSAFGGIDVNALSYVLEGPAPKEIGFLRIEGAPYFLVSGVRDVPLLVTTKSKSGENLLHLDEPAVLEIRREPFSAESLVSHVRQAIPGTPIVESAVLTQYDSYYQPKSVPRPLPVLRIKLDDPDKTWIYIDPRTSQVILRQTRMERIERWIYPTFCEYIRCQ